MTAEDFLLWAGVEWNAYGYITSITGPVHTSELEDEYTIHFSASEQTVTFTVTNGSSVSSVVTYFAVSSSSSTVPSTWYTTMQTMTPTNKYLWSYVTFNYNDGTSKETTKCVVGAYGDTGATGPRGPKGEPGVGNVDTVDNIGVDSETTNVSLGALSYSRTQSLSDAQKGMLADNMGLINLIYPVGSIYMSVNNVSPSTFLGGTWEQIKDRFLLSAGNTYAAGTTGGEAAHTLTAAEAAQKAISIGASGGHKHDVSFKYNTGQVASGTAKLSPHTSGTTSSVNVCIIADNTGKHTHSITGENATAAHNNMPPYLTVYMWKRTA